MKTSMELKQTLSQIDRKSYPAYKSLKGQYRFEGYMLSIDHVQGDPFASPSKVSLHVKGSLAGFPDGLYDDRHKRIALQDYLIRLLEKEIRDYSFKAKGSGKSGLIAISHCGQQILERTACGIDPGTGDIVVGIEIGFPANGRTINARELEKILFDFIPLTVKKTLYYKILNHQQIKATIELAEDQQTIREKLPQLGLAAFVANGAVLPRESGISDKPMKGAVSFRSPESMEVTIEVPHAGAVKGMGIKKGISLIVGGGYHGKSTLLRALELGVYNHRQGDGREFVITDDAAMKIRAEDGRSIKNTDISLFIQNLPNKKDTVSFETQDASGSTSQAANVVESIESGTSLLLIDEDTSATNFMIRDELMQRVVHPNEEPITPFIERVRELYEKLGVSSIIVAGSSGTYFHVADSIVQMDHYVPKDVTAYAKQEALKFPMVQVESRAFGLPTFDRIPLADRALKDDRRVKMKTMGRDIIQLNKKSIDLHSVEQVVDSEQTQTLGYMLLYALTEICGQGKTMKEIVDEVMRKVELNGISSITGGNTYNATLAMPRRQEIFACFNRYREMKFKR